MEEAGSVEQESKRNQQYFVLIFFLGLALRLIVFPFTSPTDCDATSRVFVAWKWMDDPKVITHGGWGPLHFYLIGAALWIWPDPVYAPIFLHLLFSVATVIPLWGFVRRQWGDVPALFVSAACVLYPVPFRLSFMALAEMPFLFFIASTMYFLLRARNESDLRFTVLAGLCLGLSSYLRYEGWMLTPFFALALWRKWKAVGIFLVAASVLPVLWMIGNVANGLHPIAMVPVMKNWLIDLHRINDNLTASEIIRRMTYYPATLFFGLTPLIFMLSLLGLIFVFMHRKQQSIWAIPFFGLLAIFVVQATRGMMLTQARYSCTLGLLLLPFAAEAVIKLRKREALRPALFLVLLTILPFSYSRVVLSRLAIASTANPIPADLEFIPRVLADPKSIAQTIRTQWNNESDGLVIDFFRSERFYSWKDTYYVALMSRVHPSKILLMPGGNVPPDEAAPQKFLYQRPTGMLILSNPSRDMHLMQSSSGMMIRIKGFDPGLEVKPISSFQGITLYRYRLRPHLK